MFQIKNGNFIAELDLRAVFVFYFYCELKNGWSGAWIFIKATVDEINKLNTVLPFDGFWILVNYIVAKRL